jgi:twitching motility protein PilT
MSLVPSLLRAIVTIDGDALVLHVGDKPYVLSASGQIDLAPRGLTYDAVAGVIAQLLPEESQKALQEYGAAQHELSDLAEFPGEHFNVVAARGGDDVWVEIRRRHQISAGEAPSEPPHEVPEESTPRVPPAPRPMEFPGVSALWPESPAASESAALEAPHRDSEDEPPQPAVVLPLTKSPMRSDSPPPLAAQALSGLDRLLRLAAARGASTLYLSSGTRPSIRVDGELQALESTPVLGPNDVESLLLTLMPERNAEALRTGSTTEWICDFPDLGRVRCMSFRDHRGPGGVFRIMPTRAVTSQQLGLSREIQELAAGAEGLVLVAGPRSSGKRTLMSALVDLINRTRHAHVITIEREINVVHERASSFVSQREAHGGADEMLDLARAALREDPDVLVLESVRSAELMNLALDAAASGRLVICGFPAHNATGAVDGIIDLFPPDARRQVQIALAQNLRGVIVQVLLNKTGGGRLAARELLLNTPAVASVIAEGKTSQLPLVIEGGRKHGMVPLNDALAGFVQSGAVDLREAFQRSQDRAGFLATLQRQGIDTSSVERFA